MCKYCSGDVDNRQYIVQGLLLDYNEISLYIRLQL